MGDKVWVAASENYQESIVCLDCFGKKELTVIMGDDSRVIIPCTGCSSGYNPPTGFMQHYQYRATVQEKTITGIEIRSDRETEYQVDNNHHYKESYCFDSKEQAEKKATELVEQHNKEEKDKLYSKAKQNKSWNWNATYYRGKIRDAEKTIKHATEALGIANVKAKGTIAEEKQNER